MQATGRIPLRNTCCLQLQMEFFLCSQHMFPVFLSLLMLSHLEILMKVQIIHIASWLMIRRVSTEPQGNLTGVVCTRGITHIESFTGTYTGPNPVPGFVLQLAVKPHPLPGGFDHQAGQVNESWKVPVPRIYQELPQWKRVQMSVSLSVKPQLPSFPRQGREQSRMAAAAPQDSSLTGLSSSSRCCPSCSDFRKEINDSERV